MSTPRDALGPPLLLLLLLLPHPVPVHNIPGIEAICPYCVDFSCSEDMRFAYSKSIIIIII